MATIKEMVKKSLKRKDGKCKIIIRLNHKCQEASIKNYWYARESDTRKNGELKCSLKHTLDIYMTSLFGNYQRNTRMKLARALLFCLQCSHRKDFATLNICWLMYPAIYCSCSPYGSNPKCCDICLTKCPFSWS